MNMQRIHRRNSDALSLATASPVVTAQPTVAPVSTALRFNFLIPNR